MSGAELPAPATLLRAFREPVTADRLDREVLQAAHELAQCHEERLYAQQNAHAPEATPGRVAQCSQVLETIDARRAQLVDRIDDWVAAHIAHRNGASLHTETLGSVIDRMAAKWVAAQQALGMPPRTARAGKNGDGRARRHSGTPNGDGPPTRNDEEAARRGADVTGYDVSGPNGEGRNGDGNARHGVDREAHLQWYRLAELTDGYRDLITEVAQHRRRLPVW
ncbi:DUF4254 domain-containing protein [Nocardia uniformis]|uniref:DUF4254 domain-containing protein n=2 Tax=Nocardia uniformis TaxID=53432 RepID=A0A849CC74_9NOCA|nr:DUF4254 domain-containing protein [Nocardia uniformis]